MEDREVECKTQLDRVASSQFDLVRLVVGFEGFVLHFLELGILGVLSNVAVVVTDHLDEEGAGFILAIAVHHFGLDDVDYLLAVLGELKLDTLLISGKGSLELLVLGILLNSSNRAAGRALRRDQILEGHREQVAFVGVD